MLIGLILSWWHTNNRWKCNVGLNKETLGKKRERKTSMRFGIDKNMEKQIMFFQSASSGKNNVRKISQTKDKNRKAKHFTEKRKSNKATYKFY